MATYDGRSVWATQVPVYEPDIVTPTSVSPVTRGILYAATFRPRVNVHGDLLHRRPLFSNFGLRADATVVGA